MGQPWDGGYGTGDQSAGGYGSGGQPPGGYGAGYGYGEQPPGGYGPGGGYGYGGYDPDPKAKTIAIIVLCCNGAGLLCCFPAAIAGIILAIIALTKADTEGKTARTLNIWAWVSFGLECLVPLLYIVFVLVGVVADPNSGS